MPQVPRQIPARPGAARGRTVFVESPTYDRPLKILREYGDTIVSMGMDDQGLLPDEVEMALEGRIDTAAPALPARLIADADLTVAEHVDTDAAAMNGKLRPRLTQQGMIFNDADVASFRAKLAPFYAQWKQAIGDRAWSLLEGHVGKLA